MDIEAIFELGLFKADINKIEQACEKLGKRKIYRLFLDIIEESADSEISLQVFDMIIGYLGIRADATLKYINDVHVSIIDSILYDIKLDMSELDTLIKNLIRRDKPYTLRKLLKLYKNAISGEMRNAYVELAISEYEDSGDVEIIRILDPEWSLE